jgi:hypothetical protein
LTSITTGAGGAGVAATAQPDGEDRTQISAIPSHIGSVRRTLIDDLKLSALIIFSGGELNVAMLFNRID